MKRRTFVFTTGVVLSASAFGLSSFLKDDMKSKKSPRPLPEEYKISLHKAIAYGLAAPNPHNTQAWKFKILNEREMLFYVDEKRLLPQTDPDTRQIHIGCGCFIESLKIGMSSLGYATAIDYFPEGHYQHRQEIGQKPIALIRLSPLSSPQPDALHSFILSRKTNRKAYQKEKFSESEIEALLQRAGLRQTMPIFIQEEAKLQQNLPIFVEAMALETQLYDKHEESRIWFRENDALIISTKDGINLRGGGKSGISRMLAEWYLKDKKPEKWHSQKSAASYMQDFQEALQSTPALLLLKSARNGYTDWLEAGRDYLRLQLACSAEEVYLHPLSQVLQEYKEMQALADKFNQIHDIQEPEKIQMVCRIGKSSNTFVSYRRSPEYLLIN